MKETFDNKYRGWYDTSYADYDVQLNRLKSLILSYNKDFEIEVARAKEKHNLKIRKILTDKLGLTLTNKTVETQELENVERNSIPVKVVGKVPQSLLSILAKYTDQQIELLLHYRKMKTTVRELDFHLKKYSRFSKQHKEETDPHEIKNTINHLESLIFSVEKSGILKDISSLGPDVFGAYFLGDHRIELYWLCIGFLSVLENYSVESYTIIVLAHELAHGYTHICFDKDGNNWNTNAFGDADLRISEGFAQFYTEMVCRDYFDNTLEAYETLLVQQNEAYTDYRGWFDLKEKDKYEKARRLLLKVRSKSVIDYGEFRTHLRVTKDEFN